MKKYIVKDTDEGLEVIENDEEEVRIDEPTADEGEPENLDDDCGLTPEEVQALKGLAAIAPKLVALINTTDSDEEEEIADEDEEEINDDDEEESDEEVLDTEEVDKPTHDSKKSIGAIQKKSKTDDSIDTADDIDSAWAKRYGG